MLQCGVASSMFDQNVRQRMDPMRPEPTVSYLQNGRPTKPRICAIGLYEAAIGDLTQSACRLLFKTGNREIVLDWEEAFRFRGRLVRLLASRLEAGGSRVGKSSFSL